VRVLFAVRSPPNSEGGKNEGKRGWKQPHPSQKETTESHERRKRKITFQTPGEGTLRKHGKRKKTGPLLVPCFIQQWPKKREGDLFHRSEKGKRASYRRKKRGGHGIPLGSRKREEAPESRKTKRRKKEAGECHCSEGKKSCRPRWEGDQKGEYPVKEIIPRKGAASKHGKKGYFIPQVK